MAGDRHSPTKLAPPPGEGARGDAFERETLHALNRSLRGLLTLGTESNRMLSKLADVLHMYHATANVTRGLAEQAIIEQQLTREALRNLTDEIALWRAERRKEAATAAAPAAKPERNETTAVKPRPVRKVAG